MEHLDLLLESVGFAFSISPEKLSVIETRPEDVLIESFRSRNFKEDLQFIGLAPIWFDRFGRYVNIPNLLKSAESLDKVSYRIFWGSLSKSDLFLELVKSSRFKFKSVPGIYKIGPDLQREVLGLDDELLKKGIESPAIGPADTKKLRALGFILNSNVWFKNRLLIGNNLRADIYTLIESSSISNAHQASEILNCSVGSAYPIYQELKLIDDLTNA